MSKRPTYPLTFMLLVALAAAGCNLDAGPRPKPGTTPGATASKAPTGSPTPGIAAAHFLGVVLGLDGKPAPHIPVSARLMGDQGSGIISRTKLMGDQGSGIIAGNTGNLISRTKYVLGFTLLDDAALTTTTDDQGRFDFANPQNKSLIVEASQGDDVKALGQLDPGQQYVLELAHTGTIAGHVKAAGVTNLLGVHVFIPGTSYAADTSEDGSFTIAHVPVGSFRLVGSKLGLGTAQVQPVDVASEKSTTAPDLVLTAASPDVSAVSPTAAGPGATVTLTGSNFGASTGANASVSVGGSQATNVKRVDDHTITFTVPPTAGSGDVVVTVETVAGKAGHLDVLQTLTLVDVAPELQVGDSRTYVVAGTDQAKKAIAAPAVSWRMEGAAATVDASGKVTGKAEGEATLVAESGTVQVSQKITVKAAVPVASTLVGGLDRILGLAFDGQGKLYASAGNKLFSIDVDAATPGATPLAGGAGGYQDGPAAGALFNAPGALALSADGTLYVADGGNRRVRTLKSGVVGTLAGSGDGNSTDGDGAAAGFGTLTALALDAKQHLYVGELEGSVRRIDLAAAAHGVTTISKHGANGVNNVATVNGLAVLPDGRLVIADNLNYCLRAATTPDGSPTIANFVGVCKDWDGDSTIDGTGAAAHLNGAGPLALAPDGTAFLAETVDHMIRQVTADGTTTTVIGQPTPTNADGNPLTPPPFKDGPRGLAAFDVIAALAVDARKPEALVLYVADGPRVRKVVIPRPKS